MKDNLNNKKILITGVAGFIGFHLAESLLKDGYLIMGIDNINDYYDVSLKEARLKNLFKFENFIFKKNDLDNLDELEKSFLEFQPNKVVNLAAQAGVRYSLKNPQAYIKSNISGFMNILECCRNYKVKGLIYASSSSVYGGNESIPFSINDRTDKPVSIYAATKKSNELMAYTYSHLFGLHTTGLRYFTVYGPWGRPDMAIYIFAKKIKSEEAISVYNHGNMKRDFTYIDDIISGTRSAIEKNLPCDVFNLGNNKWENLMDMIKIIESELGKKANIEFLDMQLGDVEKTFADIDYSAEILGYNPTISIKDGIPRFMKWFKQYNF